jgi:hypothetical protein
LKLPDYGKSKKNKSLQRTAYSRPLILVVRAANAARRGSKCTHSLRKSWLASWLGSELVRVAPSLFKIVPLDFQSLSENLLKYQICFNPFHKAKGSQNG